MFTIDNLNYSLPDNFTKLDSFVVQSQPQPYLVDWSVSPYPQESVLTELTKNNNNVLLIDRNVYEIYFRAIDLDMSRVFLVDAVEESKSIETVLEVVNFLNENNFTKKDTLVVVGGGLTQDIAAFTSKIYKRGINWVFFPTTLLSMSDSCIGGKAGINYGNAKNQLAVFSAPTKVVINSNYLSTLERREITSGLGEILKLCITGGTKTFNVYTSYVKDGKVEKLEDFKPLILASLHVKKAVIEEDEFEFNRRRSMNYGHGFGHIIEVASNYEIPHGQAVSLGIFIVNKLSLNRTILESQIASDEVLPLLSGVNLNNLDYSKFLELLKKDKKTLGNSCVLAVLRRLGIMEFLHVPITSKLIEEVQGILEGVT